MTHLLVIIVNKTSSEREGCCYSLCCNISETSVSRLAVSILTSVSAAHGVTEIRRMCAVSCGNSAAASGHFLTAASIDPSGFDPVQVLSV